jgi:hypothetical protein
MPFTDPVTPQSPIVVGGKVNVDARSLEARFHDGSTIPFDLGLDGFFVFDVPSGEVPSAHLDGFDLLALSPAGVPLAMVAAPPTDFRSPRATDRLQPIFVSTVSTDSDLTKVLAIEGSVNVPGAVTLRLRYPDGATVEIGLRGRKYHYDIPENHQDDFARAEGLLVAYDHDGAIVARAPVASVAFSRGIDG